MKKNPYMSYQIEYIHFMNMNNLKFLGTNPLYVNKKLSFSPLTSQSNVSHSPKYGIQLITEDKQYRVLMMLNRQEYSRVKQGMEYGMFSIVATGDGRLRVAKALTPEHACYEVSTTAKKQVVLIVIIFLIFILLPLLVFVLSFINLR